MTSDGYMQSDLRFLLPIAKKSRVAIIGDWYKLAEAIEKDGVQVVIISVGQELEKYPIEDASIDHIIAPKLIRDR